jgi:hypothetical protein
LSEDVNNAWEQSSAAARGAAGLEQVVEFGVFLAKSSLRFLRASVVNPHFVNCGSAALCFNKRHRLTGQVIHRGADKRPVYDRGIVHKWRLC